MSSHHAPHNVVLICLTLGFAHLTAFAEPEAPTETKSQMAVEGSQAKSAAPDVANGKATHAWMQAQASGALASKHPPILTGPVLSKIQENYIKSFESPKVDTFPKTK